MRTATITITRRHPDGGLEARHGDVLLAYEGAPDLGAEGLVLCRGGDLLRRRLPGVDPAAVLALLEGGEPGDHEVEDRGAAFPSRRDADFGEAA